MIAKWDINTKRLDDKDMKVKGPLSEFYNPFVFHEKLYE